MKVFRVHARGYVKAFALPTTICQRVHLFLRGYRRNWIGPCWGKGFGIPTIGPRELVRRLKAGERFAPLSTGDAP